MSSKHRSHFAIALFAAAIVLALLLAFRSRTPRPEMTEVATYPAASGDTQGTVEQLPKFAAAEIELSLVDLCAADDKDSATETQGVAETLAQIEEYKDLLRNVKERLVFSPEAEHLHLAALLETNPAVRVDLVTRALAINSEDAYLV